MFISLFWISLVLHKYAAVVVFFLNFCEHKEHVVNSMASVSPNSEPSSILDTVLERAPVVPGKIGAFINEGKHQEHGDVPDRRRGERYLSPARSRSRYYDVGGFPETTTAIAQRALGAFPQRGSSFDLPVTGN